MKPVPKHIPTNTILTARERAAVDGVEAYLKSHPGATKAEAVQSVGTGHSTLWRAYKKLDMYKAIPTGRKKPRPKPGSKFPWSKSPAPMQTLLVPESHTSDRVILLVIPRSQLRETLEQL